MPTVPKDVRPQEAAAAIKEQRTQEATRAMQDYQADKISLDAKSVRLRVLRLAREADSPPAGKAGPATKQRV